MHSFTAFLGLAACVSNLASAHGFVAGVKVNNNVWTAGSDPVWYWAWNGQYPETAGWDSLNQDNGFVEPASYGSADIACHKSATAGKKYIDINAGETTAGTLSWSKISQNAIESGTTWVTDTLIASNFSSSTTIPKNLKAGNYVIRHEIIALHSAQNDNGAQNYPQCLNLRVGGSGTVAPSGGTVGTGLYSRSEAGINFNLYTSYSSYPYPGPALWTAAN